VFHFSAGDSYDVFDSSVGAARFGFGAMGATGEWSVGVAVLDGQTPNLARRGQRPDVGFSVLDRTSYAREAALASFDADGFTLDHTEVSSSSAVVFSLAVAGVKTALGSFQKVVAPAPATQSVTGLAFQPEAVLFASVQDEAQPAIVVDAAFGLGVATSHAAEAVAYHDVDGVSPTRVQRIGATDTAFVALGAGGIEAEAELTSLDADGFTLTWRRNDAHATNISYCALAPAGR
jgi:hypothetical protein